MSPLNNLAERVRQVNPFANIPRALTGGAIVPYKPPTTAITPYVPPSSTVRVNPIPKPAGPPKPVGTVVDRIRANTANLPLPKTWDQATRLPSGLTPKANQPLIGKINRALARGPKVTQTVTKKVGLFAKFGKYGKLASRALGPVGWVLLAADLMENARDTFFTHSESAGFTGGQCVGVQYAVQTRWQTNPPSGSWTGGAVVTGPVRGAFWDGNGTQPYVLGTESDGTAQRRAVSQNNVSGLVNLTILSITRLDGLPDNCGNPPPVQVRDIPSSPVNIDYPDRPPATRPRIELPTRRRRPTRRPQHPGTRNPTATEPQPFPQPEPEPERPRPAPEVDLDDCNPCESLDWIVRELERQRREREREQQPRQPATFRLDVPYAVCQESTDEQGKTTKTGRVQYFTFEVVRIPGNWQEVFTESALLAAKGCECEHGDLVASFPDWWPVRLGAERAQLVVVYRKGMTNTYHQIAIPWPSSTAKPTESPLPPYRKGNFHTVLTLTDNSKMICNVANAAEGEKMLAAAKALILPSMLGNPPREHCVPRKGPAIGEADMIPVRVDYYATGQRDLMPTWRQPLGSN